MPIPPKGKINVTRIDKTLLFKGDKGVYLNFVVWPNKNGKGQYGDTHFIAMEVTQEQREAGVQGPIIGSFTMPEESPQQSYKAPGGGRKASLPTIQEGADNFEDDDIPF